MSVCNDQQTFNKAVRNAIQHIDDDDDNKNTSGLPNLDDMFKNGREIVIRIIHVLDITQL